MSLMETSSLASSVGVARPKDTSALILEARKLFAAGMSWPRSNERNSTRSTQARREVIVLETSDADVATSAILLSRCQLVTVLGFASAPCGAVLFPRL